VTKADAKTGEDAVKLLGSVASAVIDIEFLRDTAPRRRMSQCVFKRLE